MIIFLYGPDTFRSKEKLKMFKEKFIREVDHVAVPYAAEKERGRIRRLGISLNETPACGPATGFCDTAATRGGTTNRMVVGGK